MSRFVGRGRLSRLGAFVFASTLTLTVSFVGLVALAAGEVEGLARRLPIYASATAVVFVAGVLLFEESRHQGRRALVGATVAALATLLVVGLGGEGVVYALQNPGVVFEIQLLGYVLSAAMMGTGIGYWTWRNLESLRVGGIGDAL